MGVQDLWSIIEPVRESVPLYSLSGKTLAVDLSLWVCEAQHVQAMTGRVSKPHLRNLFFRVSSLTLMGVKLVFVMEGEAPKLKAETISKRTEARYGGFRKNSSTKSKTSTSRGRFKAVLKECANMLDILGVPWVAAAGEAEAMCAYLDSQGLVDGSITNDGDVFLYGAQTVYRNFNMNSKDPLVDCYKTSRVQTELHLSRENLVGLAVLLGCDYIPKGIQGVGKEQALKLIRLLNGQTLLQWFTQRKEQNGGTSETVLKKVAHCPVCHHPGSAKAHERGGCALCKSSHFCYPQDFDYQCPCDWHRYEKTRQALSFETNIRKKTMASPHFPFTEIISEFLISKDKPVSQFKRRQPNLLSMQKFAQEKMEWPKHYTSEKILILLTYAELMNRKYGRDVSTQIKPLRILKPRVRNGVPCFEVVWETPEHYTFPDEMPAEDQHEVRTIEEETLFRVACPEVVEKYLREKSVAEEKKAKNKKLKRKKETPSAQTSDDISHHLAMLSLQSAPAPGPQMPPPVISKADEPVRVDSPLGCEWNSNTDPSGASDPPNTPASGATAATVASPSDSAVIGALHLSNVDWDAASFTSSPPAQPSVGRSAETRPSPEMHNAPRGAVSRCAQLRHAERSLRDRLLIRSTAEAAEQMEGCGDPVSQQRDCKVPSVTHSSCLELHTHEDVLLRVEPLSVQIHYTSNRQDSDAARAKHGTGPAAQASRKTASSRKPAQEYQFRGKLGTDPSQSRKDMPRMKTSVCASKASCGDESDTENQQFRARVKARSKPLTRIKGNFRSGVALEPIVGAKPPSESTLAGQIPGPKPQSLEIGRKDEGVLLTEANGGAFLPNAASPVAASDSDDSVVCGESPLPLAERLRLKFLKRGLKTA